MKRSLLRARYRTERVAGHAGYDWDTIHHNRIEIINRAVNYIGTECRYLEIGCQSNICFDAIAAKEKIGVDPERGGTIRATSEEFFVSNDDTFDVIFIDGLHEFSQVRRDTLNALAVLTRGGFLLLHDLLPNTWEEAHVPALSSNWTGDVWKIAHELAGTEGITFRTIVADHGVGVVRKEIEQPTYLDRFEELANVGFDYYLANRDGMNLISFDQYVCDVLSPPQSTVA